MKDKPKDKFSKIDGRNITHEKQKLDHSDLCTHVCSIDNRADRSETTPVIRRTSLFRRRLVTNLNSITIIRLVLPQNVAESHSSYLEKTDMASIFHCLFQPVIFRYHYRFRFSVIRNLTFSHSRIDSFRSHLPLAIIFHAYIIYNHNVAFRWSMVQPTLLFWSFRLFSRRTRKTTLPI